MKANWNVHWHATNASFEGKLNVDNDYVNLRNKMIFVWEGDCW